MVEIEASLPDGTVYLAGEQMNCSISFYYPPCTDGKPITLAWSSAQLLCQCSVSESRVRLPQPAPVADLGTNDTSFLPAKGEQGQTVLSTTPKILLCNITLKPGQRHRVTYQETLPYDGPPSFKGQCVRYSYKVAIGVQRLGGATKLLRVPFRVLIIYGLSEARAQLESEVTAPSNPFTEADPAVSCIVDLATSVLQEIVTRASKMIYQVKTSTGRVGRLCLTRPAARLGEEVTGTLHLIDSDVACVQFTVSLISEESVTEQCRRKQNQTPVVTNHCSQQIYCLGLQRADFAVPIPQHTTPNFATDIVSFKWRLHFDFVITPHTTPMPPDPQDSDEEVNWTAPTQLPSEHLSWQVSVRVMPALPQQLAATNLRNFAADTL